MRYRYLDDFRRGISVFAIFSYGIAVLGTPQCPPPNTSALKRLFSVSMKKQKLKKINDLCIENINSLSSVNEVVQ